MDGIEALLNLGSVDGRTQHPCAQQAFAHRRKRRIKTAKERNGVASSSEERFDQFEVANRHGVKHEALLALVVADAIDMVERAALCRPNIMQNGASGSCSCGASGESETFQREHAEMVF